MYRLHFCCLSALFRFSFAFSLLLPLASTVAFAQTKTATPGRDSIVFKNGEKLVGTLERSTGDNIVFKSDSVGDVKTTWDKVQELHVAQDVAVVSKGVRLKTDESDAKIPVGTVSVSDGALAIRSRTGPPLKLPLNQTADLINYQTFSRVVLHRPAWYENWTGTGTVGLAIVQATQQSRMYSSQVSLVRDIPGEDWMDPESRTSFLFSSSFGELIQPNTPSVRTSIFHAVGERDRYINPVFFVFANGQFDHDYSQGLDLQQIYSGGIGWSVIKNKYEELDLRSAIGYERQLFFDPRQNQQLFSSILSETYNRAFKGATLHQAISATPSWSNLNAYSASAALSLTIPVYKHFSFTFGATDTFLNNPSPTYRKNSFQFMSGVTFTTGNSTNSAR